jgi:protein gp37
MGDTKIEWTEKTWNPVRGCSVVSEACRNCYAMAFAARFTKEGEPYEGLAYRNQSGAHWTGEVRLIERHLRDPITWKKPQMIFVNSMSDLFHESIPDGWIDKIFNVMGDCSELREHVFQILTKRPARMLEYMNTRARKAWNAPRMNRSSFPSNNVWLGVSVEDQKTADERIPLLLQTPAAVRWISAEPLLGPIQLTSIACRGAGYVDALSGRGHDGLTSDDSAGPAIDWVVVGGESGPKARPMHPDWARSLRDQCVVAGVPFFFKQWGQLEPVGIVRDGDEVINGTAVYDQEGERVSPDCCSNDYEVDPEQVAVRFKPVGKKAAGRLLDGREWSEYPKGVSDHASIL